ncbi:hypothetical protein DL96DRAFT_1238653 [Flagelloscypha sp. PMI_526]|nr:hypothetical protein DL96DRAFT_1238653 [Flagelloscypha sp. PMI_526]
MRCFRNIFLTINAPPTAVVSLLSPVLPHKLPPRHPNTHLLSFSPSELTARVRSIRPRARASPQDKPNPKVPRDPSPSSATDDDEASDAPRRHICNLCNKRFNRPSSLRIHLNTHTGATPFRCPWPHCGREFNVNSNMRRHYRNHTHGLGPELPTDSIRRKSTDTGIPPPSLLLPSSYPYFQNVTGRSGSSSLSNVDMSESSTLASPISADESDEETLDGNDIPSNRSPYTIGAYVPGSRRGQDPWQLKPVWHFAAQTSQPVHIPFASPVFPPHPPPPLYDERHQYPSINTTYSYVRGRAS